METQDNPRVEFAEWFSVLFFPFFLDKGGAKRWHAPDWSAIQGIAAESPVVRVPSRRGKEEIPVWEPAGGADGRIRKLCSRLVPTLQEYFGVPAASGGEPHRPTDGNKVETGPVMVLDVPHRLRELIARDLTIWGSSNLKNKEGLAFEVTDLRVYLFDTGAGCVTAEVRCRNVLGADGTSRPATRDDQERLVYRLRLVGARAEKVRRRTGGSGTGQEEAPGPEAEWPALIRSGSPFTMEQLFRLLLQPLTGGGLEVRAMAAPYLPVFSFARTAPVGDDALETALRRLAPTFYRMRRVYGPRYVPPSEALSWSSNPEVLRTFQRIAWGACAEGYACLVIDDGQTPFFRQFSGHVKAGGYLALYVIALHQRTALEALSLRVAQLKRLTGTRRDETKLVEEIHELRRAAFDFTVHHTYPSVSLVTMYQGVYELILERLRVEPLYRDLKEALGELDEFLLRREERAKRRLERVVAVFAPLALFLSLWGVNWREVVGPANGMQSLGDPWVLGSLAVTLAGIYLLLQEGKRR